MQVKNKAIKKKSKIPTTGRIGRITKLLAQETNWSLVEKILKGAEAFPNFSSVERADFLREAVKRMENEIGKNTTIKILQACGQMCCGVTRRKFVKKLMGETKSLEEFVEKLNKTHVGGGRLKFRNKNTIVGGYDRCFCGAVNKTKVLFPNLTYCHCSTGWYKQLFETALNRPVKVEIRQSIITGAKKCEFVIHIQ